MKKAFKSEGFDVLDEILARLTSMGATEAIEQNLKNEADAFRDYLIPIAPFDPAQAGSSQEYGHLRDNIRTVEYPATFRTLYEAHVSIGHGFWGFFLEHGTINMAPQPWFWPAWDEFEQRARRRLEKEGKRHLAALVRA